MAVSAVVLLLSEEYARIQARYRTPERRERAWANYVQGYPHQQVSAAVKVYQRGVHITAQLEQARGVTENPTLHQFAPSGVKSTDPVAVTIQVRLRNQQGQFRTDSATVGVTWAADANTLLGEAQALAAWISLHGSDWSLVSWEIVGATRYPPH